MSSTESTKFMFWTTKLHVRLTPLEKIRSWFAPAVANGSVTWLLANSWVWSSSESGWTRACQPLGTVHLQVFSEKHLPDIYVPPSNLCKPYDELAGRTEWPTTPVDTLWNPQDLTRAWHCGFCFVSAFDLNHPVLLLQFSPPEMPLLRCRNISGYIYHICHGGAHRKDSNFLNTQFEPQMMPQLATNRIAAFRTLRLKLKETQQVKCEPWISWENWSRGKGWLNHFGSRSDQMVGWCYWGAMVMFVLKFSLKGP